MREKKRTPIRRERKEERETNEDQGMSVKDEEKGLKKRRISDNVLDVWES